MTKDEKDCLAESRVVTFQDGHSLSEEEKIRLDLLANCIIEDSERVTIPDNDTQALHAEIARLRAKCASLEQALIDVDKGLTRLLRSINISRAV